jgi:3-hydroxybutyryl-CoA dehydrogenase
MMAANPPTVLVIGAGIMGAGIAQVAAQAGHAVLLHDLREGAAAQALQQLGKTLDSLVGKGKLTAAGAAQTLARIRPVGHLNEAESAGLVIEAIVEQLEAKRALFAQLEAIVSPDCILATNTSSISVTAIANGLKLPGRLVGMHFFNPVPLMKLVEVVAGLQTDKSVADAIFELAKSWGKVPVHTRSTPGFIVNRIARPYYAEALALLQEQAITPEVLDACLRGAGFRMGPCELMDLIGHDTNFSVTRSVYEANFFDKRFMPSLVQRELVDGGLLGRKSGRGFFDYREGAQKPVVRDFEPAGFPAASFLRVGGLGPVAEHLAAALTQAGLAFERQVDTAWVGIEADGAQLRLTDGRTALEIASELGSPVAVFDLPVSTSAGTALAWAPSVQSGDDWVLRAGQCLRALGFNPQHVADTPGLLVARTIAMLINEAMDAVQQGVCTAEGADAAMKLGVNYPAGPFEWLARWDARSVMKILNALDHTYRGERYRISPGLRLRALLT